MLEFSMFAKVDLVFLTFKRGLFFTIKQNLVNMEHNFWPALPEFVGAPTGPLTAICKCPARSDRQDNDHVLPSVPLGDHAQVAVTQPQAADDIWIKEFRRSGQYERVWQAYAALLPVKTVGVKGDERSYEAAISLRAVVSEGAMTADWVELPYEVLRAASNKILNSIKGINRVLYDISTKPPASIEWE